MEKYHVLTNEKLWLEDNAVEQLKSLLELPGAQYAVGLPDLHAGKGPVGMAFLSQGIFYPHLIGNDIGCGMSLYQTPIALEQYRQEKWQKKLRALKSLANIKLVDEETSPIKDLGSIGGGNHFAEFQQVAEIFDETAFAQTNIDRCQLLLLVHSGSRGYGSEINGYFTEKGLAEDSEKARFYLALHDDALFWARRNRQLVAEKLHTYLGFSAQMQLLFDLPHNFVEKTPHGWLHRKGAVSAKTDFVVIPGSRGTLTYLAQPNSNTEKSLDSLSHGAGRKWARSLCKGRLSGYQSRQKLCTTSWGSTVICHNEQQLYQEAPEAYKNIEQVLDVLLENELINLVAAFKPIMTYKG